jgi:hypothetical protein
MGSGNRRERRFMSARVRLLLVVALLSLSVLMTALTFKSQSPQQIAVARGVVNGAFHPIAGTFVPDHTILSSCGADFRCLEQAFGNLAYTSGPRRALAEFDHRRAVDKAVATDCHRIAHMIGSAALAYFKGNVAKTYSHGSPSCASGYYHGILERAFVGVDSKRGLIKAARSLCSGAGVRRMGFLDYQCVHGLGHGLMIQTGYDLPTALSVCGDLQTRWDEISCTGGVFMENGSTVYGMRSRWLKDADPLYPCPRVGLRNRASCYLRVTTQILRTNHFNWLDTAARCRALPETWTRYCFRSYGRDDVNAAGGNSELTLSHCRLTGAGEGDCLYGAARSIADRDAKTDGAGTFCLAADPRYQPSCFAGIGVVIGLLEPTQRKRIEACRGLSALYVSECAKAAAAEIAPSGRGAWG